MQTNLYENLGDGFGMAPQEDVLELRKALEAGYAATPDTQAGGGAIRTESLEASLKVLTWQDKHVVLWREMPKTRAFSTVEEYTELSAYGVEGQAWNTEGQLPATVDSTYQRRAVFVKFAGTTREVSHPMAQVRTQVGDVIARYNVDGINYLMREMERALFFGNRNLAALGLAGGAEYVEFDGLFRQIAANLIGNPTAGGAGTAPVLNNPNVIDLAGAPLDERTIRNAAQIVLDNYGIATHAYASPKVWEDYAKEYIPASRVPLPTADGTFAGGFVVDQVRTAAGTIQLRGDIFLRRNDSPGPPGGAIGAAPPVAPASVAGALAGALGGGQNFWAKSGTQVASILYRATFVNARGESAPVTSGAVAIVAADNDRPITVTITNAGGGSGTASYINLYRSDDGAAYGLIARIPVMATGGGATTVFQDRNAIMPRTYMAFIGELTPDVVEFRQLLDLIRMDLAVISPAYRWMLLLYGVLTVYAPRKWALAVNVGDAA